MFVSAHGVVLTHEYVKNIMMSVTNLDNSANLTVHLLDDGGFLIATNQPHLNTSVRNSLLFIDNLVNLFNI